jgi:hypothetical protein
MDAAKLKALREMNAENQVAALAEDPSIIDELIYAVLDQDQDIAQFRRDLELANATLGAVRDLVCK